MQFLPKTGMERCGCGRETKSFEACSPTGCSTFVDHLQELATMTGARLEVISGKMEEGVQLASLGKIGAILRYRIMQ